MTEFYPPVAFYFTVSFTGINSKLDAGFMEVSGISATINTEEYHESGENRFKHRLPTSVSFDSLVLKRGFVAMNTQLGQWCRSTVETDFSAPIVPKDITVSMLNAQGQPIMAWNFYNAWPSKWEVSEFNSMENKILVETMTFTFNYFTRLDQ